MSSRGIVIFILILLLFWFLYPSEKTTTPIQMPSPPAQEKIVKITPPPVVAQMPKVMPNSGFITPAAETTKTPPGAIYFQVKEGWAVAQGDMLIGKLTNEGRDLRAGYFKADKMKVWPQTEIAIIIDPGFPDPERVEQALKQIEAVSPFRFVPFTNQQDGLVFEQADELCASYLGRVGGFQPIMLARNCNKQQITHEVMHALGFAHEHSKPDRDQYVNIVWENIDPDFKAQFDIIPREMLPAIFPPGFDYQSIMLYPSQAFAKENDLITIQSLDSQRTIAPVQDGVSAEDIVRLNWLAKAAKGLDAKNPRPQKD